VLDDATKQYLRKELEKELGTLEFDRQGRDRLDRQIREHEEAIYALRKLLADDSPGPPPEKALISDAANTKPGTVTDEIRRLLEADPHIGSTEVIQRIRSKCPRSRIGPQSFSVWEGYFRKGRYRMDRDKYRMRYGREPPY